MHVYNGAHVDGHIVRYSSIQISDRDDMSMNMYYRTANITPMKELALKSIF